ncbi:MAG: hypothetical protein QME96_05585 [Myxococcota bacterium]|nr:hypothetical protein [Myxococcota bacterium]
MGTPTLRWLGWSVEAFDGAGGFVGRFSDGTERAPVEVKRVNAPGSAHDGHLSFWFKDPGAGIDEWWDMSPSRAARGWSVDDERGNGSGGGLG